MSANRGESIGCYRKGSASKKQRLTSVDCQPSRFDIFCIDLIRYHLSEFAISVPASLPCTESMVRSDQPLQA